jgi:hypothetical protein
MSEGPPISGQGAVPPPAQPAVPAGWYPHPTAPGWEAYWTGAGWGTETRAAQPPAPVAPAAPAAVPAAAATEVQATEPVADVQPQPQVAEPLPVQPEPQVAQPFVPEPQPEVVQPEPVDAQPAAAVPAAAVLPAAAVSATAAAPEAAASSGRSESSLPVILCFLGAIVAIVGSFLPAATSDVFVDIADNTMFAAGYGIAVIVAAALGAIIAAYCYVKGSRTWLPILLGIVVAGIAVYAGTKGLDDISPQDPNVAALATKATGDVSGTPSTGIFAVGAGGILMILGGIGLARKRRQASPAS